MSRPETGTTLFEAHRPRLVRLAYRMLGSMAEAEDIVQDAWLRWQQVDLATVDAPPAFLSRIVTRLCLDVMKSARARRETYVGSGLPEPIIEEPDTVDEDDLTLTLMLALERLSPLERAAFLLHDVFGVPLDEVAETVEREPAAVRQLAARARKHVQEARPRYTVAQDEGSRIAAAFFAASRSGDTNALRAILAQNVVIRSDGGGKVNAFINPILGLERVLRAYEGLARKLATRPSRDLFRPMRVNGLPGYVSYERDDIFQTTAFAIEDGKITEIYITRNPDKLRHVVEALNIPGEATTRH
ncbi:sigma-70 family RNA polymerase sigma factor [Afipia clevelandensis]|uniref:Sigma-70 family RNA polymerase sigma factor n=1 Tax=Afipia clevelandensis ATCC 49720 TaxID=883079 RepID=K8P2I0_9BRAD|nr:sigma-70 family RNA polymerase sigma factor [Afipia clevelandensis]EKS35671.1 sigma-70 family RNA polymerase sigma factor [Afipia clevelandensis ATCC 49720]